MFKDSHSYIRNLSRPRDYISLYDTKETVNQILICNFDQKIYMKLSVHDHSYMRVKMYKKIIHVREKLGVVFAVMDTKAWQVIQAHIIRHYIN